MICAFGAVALSGFWPKILKKTSSKSRLKINGFSLSIPRETANVLAGTEILRDLSLRLRAPRKDFLARLFCGIVLAQAYFVFI